MRFQGGVKTFGLGVGTHEPAEDALNLDARGVHADGFQLRVRGSQLHFFAKTEQAFQSSLHAIDQGHHNLAVASFAAIFD